MTNPTPSRYRDLEKLYSGLSKEEYAALEAFYNSYARLIIRMYERLKDDPEALARFGRIEDEDGQEPKSQKDVTV